MSYIRLWLGFVKNEINTDHFGDDGAIAERVADGRQPCGDIAQHSDNQHICRRYHQEIDVHIQNESARNDQVVQVGAAQFDQSVWDQRMKLKYFNYLIVLFGSEVEIEEEAQSSEGNPHSCQDNEDCGGGHMDGHRGVPCNTISRHAL